VRTPTITPDMTDTEIKATLFGPVEAVREPFTFVLEGVLPLSWNQLNISMNKYARNEMVKAVHDAVDKAWRTVQPKPPLFTTPVEIECVAYFKDRRYDCDNLVLKSILDPLKGIVIVNDSPVYVTAVRLVSLQDSKRPRTELTFMPVAGKLPRQKAKP